jgi:diacylglycerol kinase family enzyme
MMTWHAGGDSGSGRLFHACAGNSEWAGGGAMRLSPGASLDDGRLELCLIEDLSKAEVLYRFPQLLRGTFPGHPKVRYFPGTELEITSDPPVRLALDGDVVGWTPARFRILPAALPVVTPPTDGSPSFTNRRPPSA